MVRRGPGKRLHFFRSRRHVIKGAKAGAAIMEAQVTLEKNRRRCIHLKCAAAPARVKRPTAGPEPVYHPWCGADYSVTK